MTTMQTDGRGNKFTRDLGIYAIGNLGAKLITFLLVPLYTYYISDPSDFGYYDICQTVVFFLCPLVCLQLNEGGFRFLIETDDERRHKKVVTYVLSSLVRNSLIVVCLGVVLGFFIDIRYFGYIIAYTVTFSIYDVEMQLIRGLGKIKTFMMMSIFNAFSIGIFSILTVVVFDMGVPGIFIANIATRFVSIAVIEWRTSLFSRYFSSSLRDKNLSRQLLRYCLPLVPLVLLQCIFSGNNVFFIMEFLGLEENGIYAVLAKFTGMILVLVNIFYQTWQQNAIEQYNSSDRDVLFSKIFNNYFYLLCMMVALFPFFLRLNYFWLVSGEYEESAQYLFLNSTVVMFVALTLFFDVAYQCSKKTSRLIPGIVLAVIINLSGNYFMVRYFGLNGIIVSNLFTYVVLLAYRVIDSRKYMKVSFSRKNYVSVGMMAACGILYYLPHSVLSDLIVLICSGVFFVLFAPGGLKRAAVKKMPFLH